MAKMAPSKQNFEEFCASRGKDKEIMWYVYILRCADGLLYTGSTTDIDRRVKEHNRKKGGGCTRVRLPVELIYSETHPNRSEAQKRESQIKRWSRIKKLALIDKNEKN